MSSVCSLLTCCTPSSVTPYENFELLTAYGFCPLNNWQLPVFSNTRGFFALKGLAQSLVPLDTYPQCVVSGVDNSSPFASVGLVLLPT